MFSHMTVGSNDIERSRTFYDALFTAVGGKPGFDDPYGRVVYVHKGASFLVTKPIDGAAATAGNGSTFGFAVDGPDQAKAWHDAGVAAGGTAIEDDPGIRSSAFGDMYLAYLRDPDGNKLCALHRIA